MRALALAALSLAVASAARAQVKAEVRVGPLTLSDLAVRSTPPGVPTSAAYLTIANGGKEPDRLLAVECACAASAMIHESRNRNGISSMVMLNSVPVPAGGKAVFSPTGLHVMLVGLKGPLKAGAVQEMTLRFEKAGAVKAGFRVQDAIATGGHDMTGMKP